MYHYEYQLVSRTTPHPTLAFFLEIAKEEVGVYSHEHCIYST